MVIVNTHEAKTRLSELLAKVEATGEHVILCRNGHPIAEIIPIAKKVRSVHEPVPEYLKIKILGDVISPAMPIEEWPEEYQ